MLPLTTLTLTLLAPVVSSLTSCTKYCFASQASTNAVLPELESVAKFVLIALIVIVVPVCAVTTLVAMYSGVVVVELSVKPETALLSSDLMSLICFATVFVGVNSTS